MTRRAFKAGVNMASGFGLKVFSPDDLEALHYATLEVLGDVGIKVESNEALEIFHGGGAKVEKSEGYGIVKFPPYLIEDCIRWAPSNFVWCGRDPEDDFKAEPHRVGLTTFGECVQIIDIHTRKIRSSTKKDLANTAKICDYLDEIALVERPMGSLDQYFKTQPLHNYEAMVTNTGKHIFLGFYSAENTKKLIELAAACVGGMENFKKRPTVTALVCPSSPLGLVQMCCDVIIECARSGVGVCPISMVLSGATAPATLAGSLVTHNAEVLSAIVLAQLTSKGTPCTYASCSTIMDLRFASPAIGTPEAGIMSAGLTKLAQYYQIPCWVGSGHSDSKLPDAQSAYESGLSALVSALAGANLVYGAGGLESGLTFDYAKLIMDAEQFSRIEHVIKGIDVRDETIALDVIKEIGPGGEYMTHQHTFENMRSMSRSKLFDRQNREAWIKNTGGKDLTERAYEEALHILENHTPPPLLNGAAETMRSVIEDYENELKTGRR
ncbi:trimethylamine methyltransferase family protein [Desulfococcaceae bacterium HSG7]|nr:trimethylamine methyltransferase family protein [Desulfococcaceae bacterium HSG7]